ASWCRRPRRSTATRGGSCPASPARPGGRRGRPRRAPDAHRRSMAGMSDDFRVEKDALGEVRVPAGHLWGAQTQRSIDNFPIGVGRFHWGRPVIRAFGVLKKAAARTNAALGELAPDKA